MTHFRLQRISTLAGIAAVMLSIKSVAASPGDERLYRASERSEERVISYLRPLLEADHQVGRLYFAGCPPQARTTTSNPVIIFPPIAVHRPPSNGGVASYQSMFRGVANVTIESRDRDIVRITLGNVPRAILQTRITSLKLTSQEQYNPEDALVAIQNSEPVQRRMKRLGLREPLELNSHLVTQPDPRLAHMPSSIKNLTVENALDLVAETFDGIVIYGACAKSKSFDLRYGDISDLITPSKNWRSTPPHR